MSTIGQLRNASGHTICTMYISHAKPRVNNFRHHKHTAFELSLILSGSGIYKTVKKSYDISKGDVFLFSTNEQHCITDICEEYGDMAILNLQFEPSFVWNTESDNNYLKIFFDRNDSFENRLDRTNLSTQIIAENIKEIKEEFLNTKIDYDIVVKSKLICALIEITRQFGYVNLSSQYSLNADKLVKIKEAIDFINEKFSEDITLGQVAEKVYMSKTYFCTIFKGLNGVTPWEYILIKRIEKSLQLLKNTDENVLSVANCCGFNNTANFNKIFKKITGVTPKEYRKK